MIIPAKVENKIRILLNNIYNIEWSGILFYTYEGNFEDNTLIITCQDIYPMNIGSSVYTEFENTPDIAGYMVDNQLLDCCQGLIHSHHSMGTFFSATDINTLQSEGNDTLHFVSLIVNNAGEYNAAITKKVVTKFTGDINEEFLSFDGVVVSNKSKTEQEKVIIKYHMLDVEIEGKEEGNSLYERIKELKTKKIPTASTVITPQNWNSTTTAIKQNYQTELKFPIEKEEKMESKDVDIDDAERERNEFISKLVTGNINSPELSETEIKKAVNDMEQLFSITFSTDKSFDYWADSFIDCLINNLEWGWTDDEYISIFCEEIINKLNDYGTNKYLKEYENILCNYIIPIIK